MTTTLDYQGERIVIKGHRVTAPTKRTRLLARIFIRKFVALDTFAVYPITEEILASNALQKYLGAKVIKVTVPKLKKGMLY